MRHRVFASSCLLAALSLTELGCTAAPIERSVEAIMGGTDSAREGVVLIAITDQWSRLVTTCTGTLIARNLVLTARHCVGTVENPENALCPPSTSSAPASVPRVAPVWRRRLLRGATVREDTVGIEVVQMMVPPGPTTLCGRDIALLRLGEPLPEARVLTPRLEQPAAIGEVFTAAGFGGTRPTDVDVGGFRRRERGGRTVVAVGERTLDGATVGDPNEWESDGAICPGDSGGPAIDGEGRVLGVASRARTAPEGCVEGAYTSLVPYADWLREQALAASEAGGLEPPAWALPSPASTVDAGTSEAGAGDGGAGAARTAGGCSVAARGRGSVWSALGGALAVVWALRRRGRRRSCDARAPRARASG